MTCVVKTVSGILRNSLITLTIVARSLSYLMFMMTLMMMMLISILKHRLSSILLLELFCLFVRCYLTKARHVRYIWHLMQHVSNKQVLLFGIWQGTAVKA